MKHIFVGLLVLVLAGLLARPLIFPQDNPARQERTVQAMAEIAVVDQYLEYSLEGEWQNLSKILSGEALINAGYNINRLQPQNARLLEYVPADLITLQGYEIFEATVTTFTLTRYGDSYNQFAYRFFIHEGKIFKVDRIGEALKNDMPVSFEQIPAAEDVVISYIGLIEKNDWERAVIYLTGDAGETARKTIGKMPPLPDLRFENKEIRTAGSVAETAYVEAVYDTGETGLKLLFVLKNIRDRWLIEDIIIVEER